MHLHTSLHKVRMHTRVRRHPEWRWRHVPILLIVSLQLHRMHVTTSEVSLLLHRHERVNFTLFVTFLIFVFPFTICLLLFLTIVFLFV